MSNQASSIIISVVRFAHFNHFTNPQQVYFFHLFAVFHSVSVLCKHFVFSIVNSYSLWFGLVWLDFAGWWYGSMRATMKKKTINRYVHVFYFRNLFRVENRYLRCASIATLLSYHKQTYDDQTKLASSQPASKQTSQRE